MKRVETKSPSHIAELGKELARAIVEETEDRTRNVLVCGGDGSFQEFVNGVVDFLTLGSFDVDDKVQNVFRKMNLSPVPCGSCNG